MKLPFWINPVTGLIAGFLVLTFMEDAGAMPHLLVTILSCGGALAVVIWLQTRSHTTTLPGVRIKELLDEELGYTMEAEQHSGMAHDDEGDYIEAERKALERLKKRIDFEEVGR